jgi:hypothetical protein
MTTKTRPTRPAWLAADVIDDDLVQRIHEHENVPLKSIPPSRNVPAGGRSNRGRSILSGGHDG